MPSTYTRNTGIEKPANGEQSGTWGETVNTNSDILDAALNGYVELSLSGTSSTITTDDGILSDGQYRLLYLTGTPPSTHTITISPNNAQKLYFVYNASGQSVTFTQGSGGDTTVQNGTTAIIFASGEGAVSSVSTFMDGVPLTSPTFRTSLSVVRTGGAGDVNIEVGRVDGTAGGAIIDFHSGATAVNYDSRIASSGGTGSSGGGTLTITSGSIVLDAPTTARKMTLNDGYTEEVFVITDGSSVVLDPNNGSIQTWTLGANRTPSQANWAAGQSITLMIDDGTDYGITWSTVGVQWQTDDGSPPILSANTLTTVVLWKVSSTIYGARVGSA